VPLFTKFAEDTLFLSRYDVLHPLSTYSKYAIELEGCLWPSVEHYFQAMKFEDRELWQRIAQASSPHQAQDMARWQFWKVRRDWKKIRQVMMTRGLYVKCRSHNVVRQTLLDSADRPIVETSQYDYYWGCGRDGRGHNIYGKLLMTVRKRLRENGENQPPTSAP